MAASLWSARHFRVPVQQAAGLPGTLTSVFVRNFGRTRKSQLDYKGLKQIWDRPVPQHEWIKPTRARPWSRKTVERRLRPRPVWAITSEELKQIREVRFVLFGCHRLIWSGRRAEFVLTLIHAPAPPWQLTLTFAAPQHWRPCQDPYPPAPPAPGPNHRSPPVRPA